MVQINLPPNQIILNQFNQSKKTLMQSIEDLKEKIMNSKDKFPNSIIGELKKRTPLNYEQLLKIQSVQMTIDEQSQVSMKIIMNLSALNITQTSFNIKLLSCLGHKFRDNYQEFSLPTHVNFLFLSSSYILNQFVVLLKSSNDINSVIKAVRQCLYLKFKLVILVLDQDQVQNKELNQNQKQVENKKIQNFLHQVRAYGLKVIRWKPQPSQIVNFLSIFIKNLEKKVPTIKDSNLLSMKIQNLSETFELYYKNNLHLFILRWFRSVFEIKNKVISRVKSIYQSVEQFKEQVREIKQNKQIKNRLTQILCREEDQIVLKILVEFFHAQHYHRPLKKREEGIKYEEERKQEDI